ncbi:hypothetical protein ACHAPJ_005958 [Fusarium lateritium]
MPGEKKMTPEDAARIANSGTDPGFVGRAADAAKGNASQAQAQQQGQSKGRGGNNQGQGQKK